MADRMCEDENVKRKKKNEVERKRRGKKENFIVK